MEKNDDLSSLRQEAIQQVSVIRNQSKILEDNIEKSKALLAEVKTDTSEAKSLNTSLKRIISTTDASITKFKAKRENISKLLTQVNGFYEKKYLPLVAKIDDDSIGFKARLKQGTQFKNEILRLKDSSKYQYDEVKNYAAQLRKANRELSNIDSSIRKLFENSKSKDGEINKLNTNINQLDKKITKIYDNLERIFTSSQNNEKSIAQLLKDSKKEYNEILGIKTDSKNILKEIQKIYEVAAETGLSGEFDKRRKHLKELLEKWEKRIFFTSLILLVMIILMFVGQLWLYKWDMENHTFDINFYIRFLIASPVVYYLYFCSNQHSQTKKLHDRYSFKTTLAMTVKHHIQLLTEEEKFQKDDRINKILDFVLDGFNKIYSEPHLVDDHKLKLKIANMEMDIEKRLIDSISKITDVSKSKN